MDSEVNKENLVPAGKPARAQAGAGLSAGGRRVLARRDNLPLQESLSAIKQQALKPWRQETPQSTARLAPTPGLAQVGLT